MYKKKKKTKHTWLSALNSDNDGDPLARHIAPAEYHHLTSSQKNKEKTRKKEQLKERKNRKKERKERKGKKIHSS